MSNIEIARRKYPGRIITDEVADTFPLTVQLSERELASQLGVTKDHVRGYMRVRLSHRGSLREKIAGMGLIAEELAALAMCGVLIDRYECPIKQVAAITDTLLMTLLSEDRIVWLNAIRTRGAGVGVTIRVDRKPRARDYLADHATDRDLEDLKDSMECYNTTDLCNRIDTALLVTPLRLPPPEEVRERPE